MLTPLAASELIRRGASVLEACAGEVTFCGRTAKDPEALLQKTKATLVIVDRSLSIDEVSLSRSGVQAVILSDNARLDFMKVVERFFCSPRPIGIHNSVVIASSAVLASDVSIGPLSTIGEHVEIGAGTVVHAGVHIYSRVQIGRNVIIHSGAVIGADGFGYERNGDGKLVKFPHVGGVVIEDDVEIGANACIDRGALTDTRLCRGVKVDNLVHIAHNVTIGKDTCVIAQAMVGGSVQIGEKVWIGPCVSIVDRVSVGSNTRLGLGAVVTRDVPEGVLMAGYPARIVQRLE